MHTYILSSKRLSTHERVRILSIHLIMNSAYHSKPDGQFKRPHLAHCVQLWVPDVALAGRELIFFTEVCIKL